MCTSTRGSNAQADGCRPYRSECRFTFNQQIAPRNDWDERGWANNGSAWTLWTRFPCHGECLTSVVGSLEGGDILVGIKSNQAVVGAMPRMTTTARLVFTMIVRVDVAWEVFALRKFWLVGRVAGDRERCRMFGFGTCYAAPNCYLVLKSRTGIYEIQCK